MSTRTILVSPLDWGLGHATRCIPIIRELLLNNYKVILAGSGQSMELLREEFPDLEAIPLPSYDIKYPEKASRFLIKMFRQIPKIYHVSVKERRIIKKLVDEGRIDGIISDNRFGVYDPRVYSVYLTHQTKVITGLTTRLSTFFHKLVMGRYDRVWIPDYAGNVNLSGKLGHSGATKCKSRFIGPLSRMKKPLGTDHKYDYLILLSGPEPQRGLLEEKMIIEFKDYPGKILLVQGKVEETQVFRKFGSISVFNYLNTEGVQKAINRSRAVICRSGYSSIMDLSKLGKKCFLIPTPGQFEQEYLAQHLEKQQIAPYSSQDDFSIDLLKKLQSYRGFENVVSENYDLGELLMEAFSNVKENSEPIPGSLST